MNDEPASNDLIALAKKDKMAMLVLSHEIISGISNQITGVEHELLTVVRMQQKSYDVCFSPSFFTFPKFFTLLSLFCLSVCSSQDRNNETPQGALLDLFDSIHEMKTRSAIAEMAIGNIFNSQQKIDFARARIIPPASTASILEIITLQCVYEEYAAEVRS
jgi:hypothetical protein